MIKSFGCKETNKIYDGLRSKKLPQDIQVTAYKKLKMLNNAEDLQDLRVPPSNHFKALERLDGVYSIRINIQWRIVFKWSNGAEQVKIEDYHTKGV